MSTTIILDEKHYKTVVESAKSMGKTPEQFLHALIDAHARTFDEILEPARKGFEAMSDDSLDGLLDRARNAARGRKQS
jgi:hypothetical protein